MEPKQRAFSMWYTVAAMLLFFGMQAILLAPHPETVSYSEFKSLVKANKVSDLMLYKDTITGTLALTGLELSLIHISEPTRLLSISYAVFCLKKKNKQKTPNK